MKKIDKKHPLYKKVAEVEKKAQLAFKQQKIYREKEKSRIDKPTKRRVKKPI